MADLTLEGVLSYLTLDPKIIDSQEKFNAHVESNFLTEKKIFSDEETGKRIFGRVLGSTTTGVKQHFDKFGVQITGDDLKNPPEKVVEIGLTRLKELHEKEKTELSTTAGLSADERLKEANDKATKLSGKVQELEGIVKTKASEFEKIVQAKDSEVKNFKLNSLKRDTENSLNYLPDLDPWKKKGFLSTMAEKYRIDIEGEDQAFITDDAGKRIPSGKSHDTFLTPKEVYEMEAAKAGVISVNQNAGKPVVKPAAPFAPPQNPQNIPPARNTGRQIASSAIVGG